MNRNKKALPWSAYIETLRCVPTLALSKSGKVEGLTPPLSLLAETPLQFIL